MKSLIVTSVAIVIVMIIYVSNNAAQNTAGTGMKEQNILKKGRLRR